MNNSCNCFNAVLKDLISSLEVAACRASRTQLSTLYTYSRFLSFSGFLHVLSTENDFSSFLLEELFILKISDFESSSLLITSTPSLVSLAFAFPVTVALSLTFAFASPFSLALSLALPFASSLALAFPVTLPLSLAFASPFSLALSLALPFASSLALAFPVTLALSLPLALSSVFF